MKKRCLGCDELLPVERFPPDVRSRDGKQARCRECINAWIKAHYRKNPAAHMLRRARRRAAQRGLAFSLGLNDILPLPKFCPVFRTRLVVSGGRQSPNAFSLDRVDNARGYVPGNVVVMSYKANRLKNDGTAEEHEQIAAWMRQQEEDRNGQASEQ